MLRGARIVLVEDDHIMGESVAERLELEGAEVIWVKQAVRALHAVRTPRAPVHAVVCDIRLPDGSGEEVFTTLCRTAPPPPFLFITGQGDIAQAVRLMRAGAADYVTKPFEMATFLARLRHLVETREEREMPATLGNSPAAARIEALLRRAAGQPHPVLVHGPSGTGKARVAERLRALSDRAAAPVVRVDLARETEGETALFGTEGALARAGEGMLVLVAPERLSRAGQEALSGGLDHGFAGRVVAVSRLDPHHLAEAGHFRPDLLARLSRIEIPVPPLSERPEDAVWLLHEMFRRLAPRERQEEDGPLNGISSLAEDAARAHDWPGNGREVRSRLLRAIQLAEGPWIQPADLFPERQAEGHFPTLAEVREAAERRQIVAALERSGGRVSVAARLLRVSRTTLWEKMRKLGL